MAESRPEVEFEDTEDKATLVYCSDTDDDQPLLGVIKLVTKGHVSPTWVAEMAGVGRRAFPSLDLAKEWCRGVFDGASSQ